MADGVSHESWEAGLTSDERPVILVTTVELGPGASGTITLFEGDDPQEVAAQFCSEHGLPSTVIEPLTLHILENLENLEQEYDEEHYEEHEYQVDNINCC